VAVEVGEAVFVADGMGTQVMVGVGVGGAGVDGAGCGSVGVGAGADVGRMVTLGQGVTTGFGAMALAALAGVEPGWRAAGLAEAGPMGFFAIAEVREATVLALAGARSEAGRALTPCRYASAMAVTMLA
jgi:hypothetical protein